MLTQVFIFIYMLGFQNVMCVNVTVKKQEVTKKHITLHFARSHFVGVKM